MSLRSGWLVENRVQGTKKRRMTGIGLRIRLRRCRSSDREPRSASSNAFRPGGRNERPQVRVPYCGPCHSSISASFASCAAFDDGRSVGGRGVRGQHTEWPGARRLARRRMHLPRDSVRGAAGRRPAVETPSAENALGSRRTVRDVCASDLRADQCDGSAIRERRLSDAECVGAVAPCAGARHRLVPHRRLPGNVGKLCRLQRRAVRPGNKRDRRGAQLPSWPVRVSRAQRLYSRRSCVQVLGELRLARPARGARLGARSHCGIWRRSGQRHHRGDVGGQPERQSPSRSTGERGVVPPGHHAKRGYLSPLDERGGGRGSRRAVCQGSGLHGYEDGCGVPSIEDEGSGAQSAAALSGADRRIERGSVEPDCRRAGDSGSAPRSCTSVDGSTVCRSSSA